MSQQGENVDEKPLSGIKIKSETPDDYDPGSLSIHDAVVKQEMLCEDDGINSDIPFSSLDHLDVEDDSDGKPEKDSDSDVDFEDVAEKVLLFNWGVFEATVVPPCKRWCHSSRLKMTEKDHGNPIKSESEASDDDKEDKTRGELASDEENTESLSTIKRSIACKFCDKLFYWQAHLRFHVESKHPEKVDTSSKDADDEAKSKENLMCTICSKTFATLKFLKKHVSRKPHEDKPYNSTTCNRAYRKQITLDKHAIYHSPEEIRKRQERTREKRMTEKKDKKYICEQCEKRFTSKGMHAHLSQAYQVCLFHL